MVAAFPGLDEHFDDGLAFDRFIKTDIHAGMEAASMVFVEDVGREAGDKDGLQAA